MARVHTDFFSLTEESFDKLINLIQLTFDDCIVYRDVPLNYQAHLERNSEKHGRVIIKRQYVK